ncbi:MAG TPA: hypothetical protein VND62_08150 [Acidimicrobiales bacterium]|nr:hypothetical protein [Acidimicrobiales bacterium]
MRASAAAAFCAMVLGAASCGGGLPGAAGHAHDPPHHLSATQHRGTTTTSRPSSTTTTAAPPSTTAVPPTTSAPPGHGPITEPPLPPPGAGFAADQVTAIGDSVMIDYAGALENDVPGIHVTAVVSRWWTTGEAALRQLESENALGAVVIVGLGTNGPVTAAQFDAMMSVLSGASRVVFVNVRVDRTWQDSTNAVLAQGVAGSPRAFLVDWYSLAVQNPGWLYPTQTHLPIDGPGAQALAALVAGAA